MAESPEAVRDREDRYRMYTAVKEGLRVIDDVKSNTQSVQLPPRVRDDWLNFDSTDTGFNSGSGGDGIYATAGTPAGFGFAPSPNAQMAVPRQRTSRMLQPPPSPAPAKPGPSAYSPGAGGGKQPPSRPPPPSRPEPPRIGGSHSTYQLANSYDNVVVQKLTAGLSHIKLSISKPHLHTSALLQQHLPVS